MQGVESFLADELGDDATVVSDVRPGLAISKGNPLLAMARRQVARVKPRTTVVSVGAVEGFAMRGADGVSHDCCDEAWVTEYARRVRELMRIYRGDRRGPGRVFWLTIPGPGDPARVPIVAAVNSAIVRAAEDLKHVRVLRMDLLFTPQGYRETMRYRGRDVRVREGDGIHLNVAGTAIAARAVAQALRDGHVHRMWRCVSRRSSRTSAWSGAVTLADQVVSRKRHARPALGDSPAPPRGSGGSSIALISRRGT
jgi:hypothetical protein